MELKAPVLRCDEGSAPILKFTPSSHRLRLRRCHPRHLSLRLLPRRHPRGVLREAEHRQPATDQTAVNRGLPDTFRSCPIVRFEPVSRVLFPSQLSKSGARAIVAGVFAEGGFLLS